MSIADDPRAALEARRAAEYVARFDRRRQVAGVNPCECLKAVLFVTLLAWAAVLLWTILHDGQPA